MALTKCPKCGKRIDESLSTCPFCGVEVQKYAEEKRLQAIEVLAPRGISKKDKSTIILLPILIVLVTVLTAVFIVVSIQSEIKEVFIYLLIGVFAVLLVALGIGALILSLTKMNENANLGRPNLIYNHDDKCFYSQLNDEELIVLEVDKIKKVQHNFKGFYELLIVTIDNQKLNTGYSLAKVSQINKRIKEIQNDAKPKKEEINADQVS